MKKNIVLLFFLMSYIGTYSQFEDKDNDGVLDNVDECPEIAGVALKRGCPDTSKKNITYCGYYSVLEEFERPVYFNLNETIFTSETTSKLDLIVKIMQEYKEANFDIIGHSDANEKENKLLREIRRKKVIDYLIAKGISSSRLFPVDNIKESSSTNTDIKKKIEHDRRVDIMLRK